MNRSRFNIKLLFGVVLVMVVAGQLVAHLIRRRKIADAWRAAAKHLGFRCAPGGFIEGPRMAGKLDGFKASVDTYRTAGEAPRTFTRYTVEFPDPLRLGLSLTRQWFVSRLTRATGAQDIEVGDSAFDKGVVVKGTDSEAVIAFLTPARRLRCLRFLSGQAEARITDVAVIGATEGIQADPGAIVKRLRSMAGLVRQLVEPPESEPGLEAALDAQSQGRLDDALAHVREARRKTRGKAVDPEARLVEGGILYAGGRFAEAAEALKDEPEAEAAPLDDESEAWRVRAVEMAASAPTAQPPPVPAVPAPPPLPAATPEPGAVGTPDAASVCGEIFRDGPSSLEAERVFEERFAGREIAWTGTLRSSRTFTYDLVFGDRRGTIAQLDVHTLPVPGWAGTAVHAVVCLPEDAHAALAGRIGERMTFSGRLFRCDVFMRNFFVAEGRLESGSDG